MTAPETRWVLCGEVSHPEAPPEALRIGIGDGPWARVSVNIAGLEEKLTGTLCEPLWDLLGIASFVLAADCAFKRGTLTAADNGASWRRDFRFVVPVSDPDRWNQPALRGALEAALGFLSDDLYRFEFVPGGNARGRRVSFLPCAAGRTLVPWDRADDVMLFSGGMDSFGGAVEECLVHHRRPLLVSHRSSSRMQSAQRFLVDELRKRTGGAAPCDVGVEVHRHDRLLRVEESQRTRSFLFAAIAGAVAWLAGKRRVRFYENGVIALNIPITPQLLGARGTRTAHPRVLEDFATLLGLVCGEPFTVENPYVELTRADVAGRIRDAGARELLRHTRSCASIRHSTKMEPFCGVCSQCLDRQFAVRAAGLLADDPSEMYRLRIFEDRLENEHAIQLGVGYVDAATIFADIASDAEFVSRFGEVHDALPSLSRQWGCSTDAALSRVVDLYRRQGQMVLGVFGDELKARTPAVVGGAIHPESLLGRCVREGVRNADRVFGGGTEEPAASPNPPAAATTADPEGIDLLMPGRMLAQNTFLEVGDGWIVGLAGTPAVLVKDSPGMPMIRAVLRNPKHFFSLPELVATARGESDVAGTGGDDPVLDEHALSDLRERRQDLLEQEEEAREMHDLGAVSRCQEQREAIEDALAKAHGLGGRVRQASPEQERLRSRVGKAIERAIKYIQEKKATKGLIWELDNGIQKGNTVAYTGLHRTWLTDR